MSWPVRLAMLVATLVVLLSSVSSATAYRVVDGASAAHATYEPNGDRTAFSTPAGALGATYDAQDRLLTHGSTSYTYGANGELATKTEGGQTTSYTFDALGELLRVALPDGRTVEYLYDGLQRRVAKKLNGAVVQAFLHGTQQGPIAELDGAGNVVSRFVYGTRSWSPDLIVRGATTYRVVGDHLGSPRLVIDSASNAVAQRIDHDAWGAVVANSSPTLQPFGFGGGLYDADTQLVHFGSRDYDPAVGRFISKDPAGLGGGANLYTYAANDPVNHLDSDGHVAILVPILTGAAIGGLEGAAFGIASSLLANGCIDWRAVGGDVLSGAAGGALGGGLGVAVKAFGGAARGAGAAIRYSPISPGALPAAIANTFRGGSYAATTLNEATTLYRVYGGTAGKVGSYWTRTAPSGSLQSTIDLALNQKCGNNAAQVARMHVPAGTTIFEGAAAAQGSLVGGRAKSSFRT